jgi:hypothetical protein
MALTRISRSIAMNRETLSKLSRVALQRLAKVTPSYPVLSEQRIDSCAQVNSIKANLKSVDIIALLLKKENAEGNARQTPDVQKPHEDLGETTRNDDANPSGAALSVVVQQPIVNPSEVASDAAAQQPSANPIEVLSNGEPELNPPRAASDIVPKLEPEPVVLEEHTSSPFYQRLVPSYLKRKRVSQWRK